MHLQPRLCLTLLHDTRPFGSCCSAERPHLSGGCMPQQNVKCHTLNLHFSVIAFVKKKKKIKLQHRAPSTPLCRGLGLYWMDPRAGKLSFTVYTGLRVYSLLCTWCPVGSRAQNVHVCENKPSFPKICGNKSIYSEDSFPYERIKIGFFSQFPFCLPVKVLDI